MKRNIKLKYSLIVTLISAALISYEVLLSRYFSVIMSSSNVYLIVSISMMFSSFGALFEYKKGYEYNKIEFNHKLQKKVVALIISIVVFISFGFFVKYTNFLLVYILGIGITFFIGGSLFASFYYFFKDNIFRIYISDMIGAVIGIIVFLISFYQYNFYVSFSIILIYLLVSSTIISSELRSLKGIILSIAFIIMSLSLSLPSINSSIDENFLTYQTSSHTAISYLSHSQNEEVDTIYSKWQGFSRTDVVTKGDDTVRYILTDGGATTPMFKFNGDIESVFDLKQNISYLPHSLAKKSNTLLIGSGGGLDVLYARLAGVDEINAVEINKNTVDVVKKFSKYNGDIYDDQTVDLHVTDGRRFIEKSNQKYDHIYLSLVMSNVLDNSNLSLAENYVFTKEAFESYYNKINDDGMISFITHNVYESFRVANTWVELLLENGVPKKNITDYFMIINGAKSAGTTDQIHMPLIVLKKSPFTWDELNMTSNFLIDNGYSVIQHPQLDSTYYLSLKETESSLTGFYKQNSINLKPVTDDSPYFYKMNKYLDFQLLPLFILIVPFVIYLFIIKSKKDINSKDVYYFGSIGIGYIMVELGFIHLLNRFFEVSLFSFIFVLLSILLGNSVGCYMVSKTSWKSTSKLLVFLPALVISTTLFYRFIEPYSLDMSLVFKGMIMLPFLFCIGLLMGMPFPYYLDKLSKGKSTSKTIPYMYAVNGLAILIGSVLTVIISTSYGFTTVLVVSALVYILPIVILREETINCERMY